MAWAFPCLLLVRIKIGRFPRDNNSLNAIKIKKMYYQLTIRRKYTDLPEFVYYPTYVI